MHKVNFYLEQRLLSKVLLSWLYGFHFLIFQNIFRGIFQNMKSFLGLFN